MYQLPIPSNESQRIQRLLDLNIVDTKSEVEFDDLTTLVAEICDVPICLISLIDQNRQWFKSKVGLDVPEISRDISFCQYAIMDSGIMEVQDSLKDERFRTNPLVTGDPNIRSYAGAPLVDKRGFVMGTLCVIDRSPKKLNEYQRNVLKTVANTIIQTLELKKRSQVNQVFYRYFHKSLNLQCIAGMDGYFKYLNPAFSEVLGWSDEELKNEPFIHYVHPEDVELTLAEIERLSSGQKTIGFENRYRKKDGDYLWMSWNCRPDPLTRELFATARDITNLKVVLNEFEEAKKSAEDHKIRLENVINGTNLGTWEWNVQTGETIFNERWAEIIGYTLEELEPISIDTWMKFAHPEDLENSGEALQKHFTGETDYYDFSSRMKHRDGHWIWVWDRGVVMSRTPEGEPLWMYGTHQEISQQKELEDSLKNAKDMAEQSSKAKEAFIANISHEIITPLNAIIGFSDLLVQTDLNDIQSNYTDTIGIASRNLLGLINDVLDLSKIDNGGIELEQKPVDLHKLMQNVLKLNGQAAKEKDLKLTYSVDFDIPELILGDSVRINQILVNLIGNAIKFTPKGYVDLKAITTRKTKNEVEILFSVRDTGIGIAKEKLDLIFDRFAQAENSTTREFGGTGLGLSIVKMLLELHGSDLKVDSEIGKGTEFKFNLVFPIPEISRTKLFTEAHVNSNDVLSGLKILVAEDNEHNQVLATTYLKINGAIVDLAENGLEAIEMTRMNKYDVILMDLQMPKMDGFEATGIIRNELKLEIPIVACTAHSLAGERNRSIQIGMDDYITKPYAVEELLSVIIRLTNSNKYPSARSNDPNFREPSKEELTKIVKHVEAREEEELTRAMIEIFRERTPEDIKEMEKALKNNQLEIVSKKAHLVAGSLGQLNVIFQGSEMVERSLKDLDLQRGFKIAKETEKMARKGVVANTQPKAKDLISYLKKTLDRIDNT